MSTRAVIAHAPQPASGDWTGVYQHFDGYPTELGKTLHTLCRDHFGGDADALGRHATADHAAWRYIAAPGDGGCFCHGDRPDPDDGTRYRPADLASDQLGWIEWVYIIEPDRLIVLAPCERSVKPVGHVAWGDDPADQDWTRLECGEHFERCAHYAWVHFDVPEEAKRLTTAKWLGTEPLDPVLDAIGWRLADGTLARRGGHGYAGTFRGRQRGWYEGITLPDDTRHDLRVCRGERERRLRSDLTPVYPPTRA